MTTNCYSFLLLSQMYNIAIKSGSLSELLQITSALYELLSNWPSAF